MSGPADALLCALTWKRPAVVPAGSITYFPCGAWLGAAGRSGAAPGTAAAPLDLPAHQQDPRPPVTEYQVSQHDKPGQSRVLHVLGCALQHCVGLIQKQTVGRSISFSR
jgi:hypothetical protein